MIKVIFFGTPDIGINTLEHLNNSEDFEVVAVVTQPDKPAGRGNKIKMSPIKKYALDHNIPIFQPNSIRKEPDIIKALKKLSPDFFVTFAFGQILSQEVLDIPKFETINLHASLLPKYRGANPIQRAIINGDKETGICTMITELGLDCGDVCKKIIIPISDNMNCEELYNKIQTLSPKIVEDTLKGIYIGTLIPEPQCSEGICFANKLDKEETCIDFSKSAKEIHDLVRGIYKSPSAYFKHNNKIIKVLQTEICDGSGVPGKFIKACKEGLIVACGEKCILLKTVKPEGKGEMSARDWYNGLQYDKKEGE